MEITLPAFIGDLCSAGNIRPFPYYVERSPWRIRLERVQNAFLNKKGIYCFWWSGDRAGLLNEKNALRHLGFEYRLNERCNFDHGMVPIYVGMTAKAAKLNGRLLQGRLIDRLVRFPHAFREWKKGDRFELCKRKTGTCGTFDLFNFPERIRSAIAEREKLKELTLEAAEQLFLRHPDLVDRFQEEYKDVYHDNYSISFVAFTDEVEMFFAEALAIGILRPWLNHS